MSYLKNTVDLENLRYSCRVLISLLNHAEKYVKPGQDCGDWNNFVEDFFDNYNCKPSFKDHHGYKYNICISIGDEVVHGIAKKGKIIPENTLVSFDCGAIYKGMFSDSARTVAVGTINNVKDLSNINPRALEMMKICDSSLDAAIKLLKSGVQVRDISKAINDIVKPTGFGNVVELGGHGVGYEVWSAPYISHQPIKHKDQKTVLLKDKIICIEPMLTLGGSDDVSFDDTVSDGWTVRTSDGSLSCHSEHEIIITKEGHEVLTQIEDDQTLEIPLILIEKYKNSLFQ